MTELELIPDKNIAVERALFNIYREFYDKFSQKPLRGTNRKKKRAFEAYLNKIKLRRKRLSGKKYVIFSEVKDWEVIILDIAEVKGGYKASYCWHSVEPVDWENWGIKYPF